MKIIDLLNKIANGEDVPKKIAISNDVLIYNEKHNLYLQDYYYMADEEDATWKIWAYELNDEVEILEEEKKIPEKLNYPYIEIESSADDEIRDYLYKVKDKFDEIIDYLKSKGK